MLSWWRGDGRLAWLSLEITPVLAALWSLNSRQLGVSSLAIMSILPSPDPPRLAPRGAIALGCQVRPPYHFWVIARLFVNKEHMYVWLVMWGGCANWEPCLIIIVSYVYHPHGLTCRATQKYTRIKASTNCIEIPCGHSDLNVFYLVLGSRVRYNVC